MMTPGPKGQEHELPEITPGSGPVAPKPPVNPRLSANLNADYQALQNDMEQARELAADFQRQLAGKSNEFAQLKQLFEKTAADLASLQAGIVELRAERHQLANEAMRSTAFQMKLKKVSEERDHLRVDLEFVRKALAQSAEKVSAARSERDAEVASLVIELVTLKETLAQTRRELEKAKQAQGPVEKATAPAPSRLEPVSEGIKIDENDDFIDISFGR